MMALFSPVSGQRLLRAARYGALPLLLSVGLVACSSYKPPPPSPLQPNPASVAASTLWSHKLGADVAFPLAVSVQGNQLIVGDSKGGVTALDVANGAPLWQARAGASLMAGIGSDGTTTAVVTGDGELVALRRGTVAWRIPLQAQAYTAPYVAGGRVFVLTADRSVSAFDAGNGYRLWQQKAREASDNLVLRQNSLLTSLRGALLAGVSGRIVALNPDNGTPLGDTIVAAPHGGTDTARLVDVLAPASVQGNSVCARAYQAAVACVDYTHPTAPAWSQPSDGESGVGGNAVMTVGTDRIGDVVAWSRADGKPLWKNTTLRYRGLGAPLVVGDNVIVGDSLGIVHVLSAQDGTLRNRVVTDGSAIRVAPVLAGHAAIVVSDKGSVTAVRVQ